MYIQWYSQHPSFAYYFVSMLLSPYADRFIVSCRFLAAQSSSRCLVVRRSVGPLVTFVKKLPLEHQMVTKTYLPYNLYDSSDSSDSSESYDSSDSSDSSDSCYSSDSSDSSDQKQICSPIFFVDKYIFFTKKTGFHKINCY